MSNAYAKRLKFYRLGIMSEYLALLWLCVKGYWPIATRYKTPVGEIDLVVRRGRTLAFIEVKARANREAAALAIHHKNQSRVVRASHYFLASHPEYQNYQVRFDAVLIAWYALPKHHANAFGE